MPLPLVSRRAYDEAVGRYTRAEAQVDRLTDALVRLERVREGLRETPPPERKPIDPMPRELARLANEYETEAVRERFIAGLEKQRRQTGSWEAVMRVPEVAALLADAE